MTIRSAVRGLAALSRQSIIGRWRRSGKPPIGIETLQTPMQSEFFFVKMINCTCQIYNEPFIVPLFKYAFKLIVNVKYIMNLPLFKYTCALFYCFVFLSHDAIVLDQFVNFFMSRVMYRMQKFIRLSNKSSIV